MFKIPDPTFSYRQLNRPMLSRMRYLSETHTLELETELNRCLTDLWFTRHFCAVHPKNCVCLQADNRTLFERNDAPEMRHTRRNSKSSHPLVDESVHNELVNRKRLSCALLANNPQVCKGAPETVFLNIHEDEENGEFKAKAGANDEGSKKS